MPTATPKSFGRYQVISSIGAGAMGSVYLARDDKLGREVAIKAIRDMNLPDSAAALMRARFDNEARAVAALKHPNVVQVFDIGVEGDTPYLVMEVIPGASLRDRIKSSDGGENDGRAGRLDVAEVCALGAQMASVLQAAHAKGIVHRDVKPANILQAEPGVWKLTDFGVARVPDSSLTLAGQFLGSPAYAAPEALREGQTSPAADVYGLGATLYEALVGEPPYGPRGLMTAGALASHDPPAPMSRVRPDVPGHVEGVILAAVARDPEARPSAAELARVLGMPPVATAPAAMATPATMPPGAPASMATPGAAAAAMAPASMAAPGAAAAAMAPASMATPAMVPMAMAAPGASMAAMSGTPMAPVTMTAAPAGMAPAGTVLTPAAHGHVTLSRRRKRILWLVAAFVAVLVLGIMIGSSEDSPGTMQPGAYGAPPAPAASSSQRRGQQRKRWNKAQEKISEGEYGKAAEELEKLLRENPDDHEARALLDWLLSQEAEYWDD